MTISKNTKINIIILTGLVILSLTIGIFAIKYRPDFPLGDQKVYNQQAINFLKQGSISGIMDIGYNVKPPIFMLFVALIYKIFGIENFNAVYIAQFILLGLMAYIVFLIANKHFKISKKIAIIPGLLIVFWPYFILHAILLLRETIFSFVLILFIYLLLNYIKKTTLKNAVILGLGMGLAIMTRENYLLLPFWIFILILVIFLLKKNLEAVKPYFKTVLIALTIYILFALAWVVPYWNATHRNDQPVKFVASEKNLIEVAFRKEWSLYQTPGYEPDKEATLEKAIVIKLKNIYRFWKSGASGTQAEMIVAKFPIAKYMIYLYHLIYYALLILTFLSILLVKNKIVLLLWLTIIYFWILHASILVYPRYTLPVIPLMILLVSYTIYNYRKFLLLK